LNKKFWEELIATSKPRASKLLLALAPSRPMTECFSFQDGFGNGGLLFDEKRGGGFLSE
jgi:hypothetical protein